MIPSPRRRPLGSGADASFADSVDSVVGGAKNDGGGLPSSSRLLSCTPLLDQSMSTDSGSYTEEVISDKTEEGGRGGERTSTGSTTAVAAWASAAAAAEAARLASAAAAAAAAAAAEAVAKSAAAAAEEAALAEEITMMEALQEVRSTLAAGGEKEAGGGAEVERVATGVGLAPALLGALRALETEGDSDDAGTGVGRVGGLATDVSWK